MLPTIIFIFIMHAPPNADRVTSEEVFKANHLYNTKKDKWRPQMKTWWCSK